MKRIVFAATALLMGAALYSASVPALHAEPIFKNIYAVNTGSGSGHDDSCSVNLDNDGDQDLAVVLGNYVKVFLNPGNGCFVPGRLFPITGSGDKTIHAADLNGDGFQDVFVTSYDAHTVDDSISVLMNDRAGGFAACVSYSVDDKKDPSDGHTSAASGDLDADGDTDIVVTCLRRVVILKNVGGGLFVPGGQYGVGLLSKSVAVGDLNHDGYLDFAVACSYPHQVFTYINNGDGTFIGAVANPPDSLIASPKTVKIADMNCDGNMDLIVGVDGADKYGYLRSEIYVMLNNGLGSFSAPSRFWDTSYHCFAIADLDNDGDNDVAIGTDYRFLSILLNDGTGCFAAASPGCSGYHANPAAICAADYDGDGLTDLATFDQVQHLHVSLNKGEGMFHGPSKYGTETGNQDVCAADLDNDGDLDLAVASINNRVLVYLNQGNGTFAAPAYSYYAGVKPYGICAADLNKDGAVDLVTANENKPNNVSVLFNRGDGTFSPPVYLYVGAYPYDVICKDLDNDGDYDLVTANYGSGDVSVLLNLGNGTFSGPTSYAVGAVDAMPYRVLAADMNNDGFSDLVVTCINSWQMCVLLNNGDGSFAPAVAYSFRGRPIAASVADLDGDGDQDVVVVVLKIWGGDELRIFANAGDGTLALWRVLYLDTFYANYFDAPDCVTASDFDRDGDVDLAVGGGNTDNILILLNDGNGSFHWHGEYSYAGAYNIISADLDGNGFDDLASVGGNEAGVYVLINANTEMPNEPPTLSPISIPVDLVPVGTVVYATANFTDPDVPDHHAAVWDWGDMTTSPGTVIEANGSGTASGNYRYVNPGVYRVTIAVTDDDGAAGEAIYEYVVVYDPYGGFVTGGGWINSPLGAYALDPTLTGKATFGFVAKYLKGANVPSGNTEFQFKAGDLNFKSTAYDWLVVAGARAQFKGWGTINGQGNYAFILTAIDGQINGGGGADWFRIKIWDIPTDVLLYDNQVGDGDDTELGNGTFIQGGSIVIHKP